MPYPQRRKSEELFSGTPAEVAASSIIGDQVLVLESITGSPSVTWTCDNLILKQPAVTVKTACFGEFQ
jgi:hypothetical protein